MAVRDRSSQGGGGEFLPDSRPHHCHSRTVPKFWRPFFSFFFLFFSFFFFSGELRPIFSVRKFWRPFFFFFGFSGKLVYCYVQRRIELDLRGRLFGAQIPTFDFRWGCPGQYGIGFNCPYFCLTETNFLPDLLRFLMLEGGRRQPPGPYGHATEYSFRDTISLRQVHSFQLKPNIKSEAAERILKCVAISIEEVQYVS